MKGVFKLSTITLLIILSVIIVAFCQDEYDDIDEKPTSQFTEKIIILYRNFFTHVETKIVSFHTLLLNNYSISYPYDVVIFFFIGCLVKILFSCVFSCKKKDNYVYNTQDNAEGLYNIINVRKYFLNLLIIETQ